MPRERKTINVEIGKRIQGRREQLNMTREGFARQTGYSSNFIQEAERGRSGLSSESLRIFATALDVSTDYLLFGQADRSFDHVVKKLSTVPPEKLDHVLKIIDEAIACSQS